MAFINSYVKHDEFVSVNNVLKNMMISMEQSKI